MLSVAGVRRCYELWKGVVLGGVSRWLVAVVGVGGG